jgi:hypothetical protein
MIFLYVGTGVQYGYSPLRMAIAEYTKRHDGNWQLDGWLWDGQLATVKAARGMLTGYLSDNN